MTARMWVSAVALAVAVLWWVLRDRSPSAGSPDRSPAGEAAPARPVPAAPAGGTATGQPSPPAGGEAALEGESRLADALNAPGGTLPRDLEILNEVFEAWISNFPRDGNPVGENAEITAALTGGNALRFAFIPRGHPAINAAGELCDRWGTPFRFHQLSGRQMEIRSAGPDRRFGTEDDATWTPP